ncbi:hypothetical protein GCM10020000_86410 [Streptomyces olivoverticillatus]
MGWGAGLLRAFLPGALQGPGAAVVRAAASVLAGQGPGEVFGRFMHERAAVLPFDRGRDGAVDGALRSAGLEGGERLAVAGRGDAAGAGPGTGPGTGPGRFLEGTSGCGLRLAVGPGAGGARVLIWRTAVAVVRISARRRGASRRIWVPQAGEVC